LDERVWSRAVSESTARAQGAGATGVPAFVIDWRVLVVGAQPRELLAQAVEQARTRA
jgi:predicted DsbA family dithiol-disulfide isomerase